MLRRRPRRICLTISRIYSLCTLVKPHSSYVILELHNQPGQGLCELRFFRLTTDLILSNRVQKSAFPNKLETSVIISKGRTCTSIVLVEPPKRVVHPLSTFSPFTLVLLTKKSRDTHVVLHGGQPAQGYYDYVFSWTAKLVRIIDEHMLRRTPYTSLCTMVSYQTHSGLLQSGSTSYPVTNTHELCSGA